MARPGHAHGGDPGRDGIGAGRLRCGQAGRDPHADQDQDAHFYACAADGHGHGAAADRHRVSHAVAHAGPHRHGGADRDARAADPGAHPGAADRHAAAPAPRPAAPRPTARPVQPTAPPPPPAAADPCAGIGGDGCKWRVTGGPAFGENGGQELKLQFIFLHSGVDGGQPQGSYFVVLEKDGQRLPISDSVRSLAHDSSQGSLGKFNYEYALGMDKLPGNTVAGNYTLWVLDGNGERDSRNITFSVPANSGLIWIQFDQA